MCRKWEYRNETYICGGWIVNQDAGATIGKERSFKTHATPKKNNHIQISTSNWVQKLI